MRTRCFCTKFNLFSFIADIPSDKTNIQINESVNGELSAFVKVNQRSIVNSDSAISGTMVRTLLKREWGYLLPQ